MCGCLVVKVECVCVGVFVGGCRWHKEKIIMKSREIEGNGGGSSGGGGGGGGDDGVACRSSLCRQRCSNLS